MDGMEMALELEREESSRNDLGPGFMKLVQQELEKSALQHDKLCSSNPVSWRVAYNNPRMEFCFNSLINSSYQNTTITTFGIPKGREKAWITLQKESAPFHTDAEDTYHVRRNFISICAGNTLISEEERSSLKCWYERKKTAYLIIVPLKFEKLSASPEIFQIYDIIGRKALIRLKRYAVPTLARRDVKPDEKDHITQAMSILNGTDRPQFFNSVARQIEVATGLNVIHVPVTDSISEHPDKTTWMVVRYRASQHYLQHKDAIPGTNEGFLKDDRIGTFMLYLSDVEVGGGTAFPVAGVAARPISGSGVFWYNLNKNGDVDHRTWHGGCPVVFGFKWILNKSIMLNSNFAKRPCSLNPEE